MEEIDRSNSKSIFLPLKYSYQQFLFCCCFVFLFLFYFINWRLITILWWFWPYIDMNQPRVYMCPPSWTPLPPPFPSHPSGSSQCTSPKHPVSCIEPGLAICFTYDNIHVSVLFRETYFKDV